MIKTYKSPKVTLLDDEVFVWGANLQGFHAGGAAGWATSLDLNYNWRTAGYEKLPDGTKGKWNEKGKLGPQVGTEGKSYAIPTVARAGAKRSIPLPEIKKSIEKFYNFAKSRPHLKFFVAQENKMGLNGYEPLELAEIYSGDIPENVYFDEGFASLLSVIPESLKKTLAVIGTAGRKDDYNKLTADHYWKMVDAVRAVIKKENITHLVSGGAAWSDWTIYEIQDLPRKTYLPENPKDLGTAQYYHDRFFAKVPNTSKPNGEITHHGGFLDRNLLVAKDADMFLAMTFGNKSEVKDGGTKHTVNAVLKQGKQGYHLDLNDLKLYSGAK